MIINFFGIHFKIPFKQYVMRVFETYLWDIEMLYILYRYKFALLQYPWKWCIISTKEPPAILPCWVTSSGLPLGWPDASGRPVDQGGTSSGHVLRPLVPWFYTSQSRIYKSCQSLRKQSKELKGDRFLVKIKSDSSLAVLHILMSVHGNIDNYLFINCYII